LNARDAASGVSNTQATVTPTVDDRDVLLELATTAIDAPVRPPSLQRLADLEARIRRAVAQGRSEATLRAYTTDWADFATWCRTVGFDPLPAAPGVIAGYVSEMAFPLDDRSRPQCRRSPGGWPGSARSTNSPAIRTPARMPWSERRCAVSAGPSVSPPARNGPSPPPTSLQRSPTLMTPSPTCGIGSSSSSATPAPCAEVSSTPSPSPTSTRSPRAC
jgi:hypothetical protein